MRGVYLNDWLVGRATGKEKVTFDFLKMFNQNRRALSVSGTLRLAAFVFPNGLKR